MTYAHSCTSFPFRPCDHWSAAVDFILMLMALFGLCMVADEGHERAAGLSASERHGGPTQCLALVEQAMGTVKSLSQPVASTEVAAASGDKRFSTTEFAGFNLHGLVAAVWAAALCRLSADIAAHVAVVADLRGYLSRIHIDFEACSFADY